jgi:hypothetical protein
MCQHGRGWRIDRARINSIPEWLLSQMVAILPNEAAIIVCSAFCSSRERAFLSPSPRTLGVSLTSATLILCVADHPDCNWIIPPVEVHREGAPQMRQSSELKTRGRAEESTARECFLPGIAKRGVCQRSAYPVSERSDMWRLMAPLDRATIGPRDGFPRRAADL